MSYILEALKKKDSDKEGDVPDLSSHHYQGDFEEESNHKRYWLLALIGLLVMFLVIYMAFRIGQNDNGGVATVNQSIAHTESSEQQNIKPVKEVTSKKLQEAPKVSQNSNTLKIESSPIEVQTAVVEKVKYLAPKKIIAKVSEKIKNQSVLVTDVEINSEPVKVGNANLLNGSDSGVNNLNANNLDPNSNFSALPSLRYNTHVYADNPKDRFISLNGKTYGIGEKLSNGVKIEDILEDDLVISYRKKSYTIPSLTDINL